MTTQDDLPELLSESEALRRCNLPATSRWRAWIRHHCPRREVSGGWVYRADYVRELVGKIRDRPPGEPKRRGRRLPSHGGIKIPVEYIQ
jgi:hypothetical protein